ncbi:MAG TPA: transglycosylase domain-containing protein [Candidatus Binataceae bacterium]|nr:transglycosylase domain-containing protein [Candidatus Binataceae bacterium]
MAACFGLGFYLAGLYQQISYLIEQRKAALTSSVYSAPTPLMVGSDVEQLNLLDRLGRLSYTPVAAVTRPGEYSLDASHLVVYLRAFRWGVEQLPAALVVVTLDERNIIQSLRDPSGAPIRGAWLEPEVIGRLQSDAPAERVEVPLNELRPYVVRGLLATEDRFFYYHFGVDPIRIVEAALADLRSHRLQQGASTITQQLARTFLTRQRTFSRKLNELAIALVLEARLSKNEILERYINDVPMGDYRGVPVYGLPMAARYLFNQDLREVTPAQAATLIGMIRAPSLYDPRRHPQLCVRRRDTVLGLMRRAGVIDEASYRQALATPLVVRGAFTVRQAPYFVDYVASQVAAIPGFDGSLRGVTVYTTLDPELQQSAQNSLLANLSRIERTHPRLARATRDPLQSSMVVLDVASGAIRALIGGRDYSRSQYDRAVMAQRQPGSAFKPIVFVTAMDPSRSPLPHPLTLASLLPDRPMSFGGWTPANYEHTYKNQVTVAETLAESLNVPTAYVGSLLGPHRIIETAYSLGISTPLPSALSISIGAGDVTLLDLVGAYQVFANQGVARPPYAIEAVVDNHNHLIYQHQPQARRLFSPAVAYLITGALKGVLSFGTGAAAQNLGLECPAAGKTGTTDDYRDAYFIGYTPRLVAGVWVGRDTPLSIGLTGAQAALPAWVDFMQEVAPANCHDFPIPAGITLAAIDPDSGGLATPACPRRVVEPFLPGTAPTHACGLHGGNSILTTMAGAMGLSPSAGRTAAATTPAAATAANANSGGFFGHVAGFFGAIFHH